MRNYAAGMDRNTPVLNNRTKGPALLVFSLLLLLSGFSIWMAREMSGTEDASGEVDRTMKLARPYIIAATAGIILSIQALLLLRKKQWKAVLALSGIAALLLAAWLTVCRFGLVSP